jgi:rhomboid protease GluP
MSLRPSPSQVPRITGLPINQPVRVLWVLLGLNIALFLVTQGLSLLFQGQNGCLLLPPYSCALAVLGWKQNTLIAQGDYWRLLTATFLHGGALHLLMNGFSLYILGPDSERVYGIWRFLAIYLLAGLAGSIASYAFNPAPSIGASGSVFGLIGALAVFFYRTRDLLGEIGMGQLQGIVVLGVVNLVIGFSNPIVDNAGHIGGLLGGALAAWALLPAYTRQIDIFAPAEARERNQRAWIWAAGLLALLVALALLLPPAL